MATADTYPAELRFVGWCRRLGPRASWRGVATGVSRILARANLDDYLRRERGSGELVVLPQSIRPEMYAGPTERYGFGPTMTAGDF